MIEEMLALANPILLSVNVIIGFSLFVYVFAHNFRSPVAQAYCALTAFVTLVYIVDLGLDRVLSREAAETWLRLQWAGIAFVPAAYLHFSEAILRTTGRSRDAAHRRGGAAGVRLVPGGRVHRSHRARIGTLDGSYTCRAALFRLPPLCAGQRPGWGNILRAEARCLTSTSRRRMAYLKWAFAAPGIGVFPYLLIPVTVRVLSADVITPLTLVGNMATGFMIVVIGYIVAYQGVLLPDRVIKHNLLHFLLRGPLVAILVVALMLTVPRVEEVLGLPRDTVLIVTVVGGVVLLELFVGVAAGHRPPHLP